MSAGLNLAQLQAVHYTDGPCLVLAGAGSGKTRVITHKIGRLIETGLAPRRIAAITFTNKAAAEMRERAAGLIGRQAKEVLICTFHSLGVRMVREDGHILGLKPQFSILDTDDVTGILKDCAGGTTDVATARHPKGGRGGPPRWGAAPPVAVDHQRLEEPGLGQPQGPGHGPGRQRTQHRSHHAAL